MVLDPPRQPVNVNRMIIYSFIPILGAYAAWRIQKFWLLLIINFGIGIPIQFVTDAIIEASDNPILGLGIALAISIPLSVLIVRHFAREYNNKIAASTAQPSPS